MNDKEFQKIEERYYLDKEPEYELRAVKDLIHSLFEKEAKIIYEIRYSENAIATQGGNDFQVDEHIDLLHYSGYLDSACSHAAVGALAPFFEGFFVRECQWLRSLHLRGDISLSENSNERWKGFVKDEFWNPRMVFNDGKYRKELASGLLQIIDALAIRNRFPEKLPEIIGPLFYFRNKVFHNGYEWPIEQRTAFVKAIRERKWDDYFDRSTSGGEPKMFYPKKSFLNESISMAEEMVVHINKLNDEMIQRGLEQANSEENVRLFEESLKSKVKKYHDQNL